MVLHSYILITFPRRLLYKSYGRSLRFYCTKCTNRLLCVVLTSLRLPFNIFLGSYYNKRKLFDNVYSGYFLFIYGSAANFLKLLFYFSILSTMEIAEIQFFHFNEIIYDVPPFMDNSLKNCNFLPSI